MAFLIIILICYFITNVIKKSSIRNEWLPLISGGTGALLALISFYTLPIIVPVNDVSTTLVYGFFLGLSATGSNQVVKQTMKFIQYKFQLKIDIPTDIIIEEDNKDE